MKFKLIIIATFLFLVGLASYAQTKAVNIDATIRKIDSELLAALEKGDAATLDRMLSKDFIQIDSQGLKKDKMQTLELARNIVSTPPSHTVGPEKSVSEVTINSYADAVVITGLTTIKYQFMEYQTSGAPTGAQNPAQIDQERFSRIYVKSDGRWQLLLWQTTHIAKR